GQCRQGCCSPWRLGGHVDPCNDSVADFAAFWRQEIEPGPWRRRYILAHSMGGAIATLFLQRHRVRCDAIALTAPLFGIVIRLPSFMVRHILDWAEGHQRIREDYAIGTGQWRAVPFGLHAARHRPH
ncbi:alpha/beta fold hydrolase, partial [Salmonella enterica]|uniref:alpha/beta fold hydrolase n=1 Tax=Salmonella enterica TaxID=28901 RepID=UPI00398C2A4F